MGISKLQGIVLVISRYRSNLSSPSRFQEIRYNSSSFVDRSRRSSLSHLQGRMLNETPIPMAKNDNVSGDVNGSSMPNSSSKSAKEGKQPPPSSPLGPKPWFPVWIRWLAGSILTLLVSMLPKGSTFLRIGGEAEVVLKEAEQVAEMVEKVATLAERVAEEVADQFPDQPKLKEAATLVENISKEAAKDAHLAEQIIHKVDSMEQDLEGLETLVEPIVDKIIQQKKS